MASCRVVLALLLCVTFAMAKDHDSLMRAYDSGDYVGLRILEIRKVQRESSLSGHEHNVRILLANHTSIPSLAQWSLTTFTNSSVPSMSTIPSLNPRQTEMEFEADLTNVTGVFVEGLDLNNGRVAMAYTPIDTYVMNSRLAWVGGPYDPSLSSLRVWPGSQAEVWVGAKVCRSDDAPCYFLEGSIPRNISRCQDTPMPRDGSSVKQCDEVITQFQETEEAPRLKISDNNLTVSISLRSTPAKIEAVAYNPQDPRQVFSPKEYHCLVEVSTLRAGQEVVCHQSLQTTEDVKEAMVLVVAIDHEGYVNESRLALYVADSPPKNDNTDLIVGCVVGGICLIAIFVAIVVFFVKDKKNKGMGKSKSKKAESGEARAGAGTKYEAAPTSEPPAAPEEEERVEA